MTNAVVGLTGIRVVWARRAVQGYSAFEHDLTLIKVFAPQFSFQTDGEHNPVIRVYKIYP